jgi:mannose-6-phosphate isomerase-like protein (cupin superfamily)
MPTPPKDGAVFPLSEVRALRKRAGGLYVEFLRVPAMSVGFYTLHAGGVDPQTPHREDEVYYVIRGRGAITIAGRDYPVESGETIFVAKGVDHRFHSVTEPLELLVVFAPAESPDLPAPPPAAPGRRGRP